MLRFGLLALAALVLGCGPGETTQLVVVVDGDLRDLESVRAQTHDDPDCPNCSRSFPAALPFSFGVVPRDGDASRPVAMTVEGVRGGAVIVRQRFTTGFVAGERRRLDVRLDAACLLDAISCPNDHTCERGQCVPADRPAHMLPRAVPGDELPDAGIAAHDGGTSDPDAGEPMPRGCEGREDGAHVIDVDGTGPEPPFDVWCTNGWAVLGKVDGTTNTLGFDAPAWTGPESLARPVTELVTREDALYPAYWRLPIDELRVVMVTTTMASANAIEVDLVGADGPITLRGAMDAGSISVTGSAADWVGLLGRDFAASIPCEVRDVPAMAPTAAPLVRARVGLLLAEQTCTRVAGWVGLGASIQAQSQGNCVESTTTAGGGRICGGANQRFDLPALAVLMGRAATAATLSSER